MHPSVTSSQRIFSFARCNGNDAWGIGRQRAPDGGIGRRPLPAARGRGRHHPLDRAAALAAGLHRDAAHSAGGAEARQHGLALRALLPRHARVPGEGLAAPASSAARAGGRCLDRRRPRDRRRAARARAVGSGPHAHAAQGELHRLDRRHGGPRPRLRLARAAAGLCGLAPGRVRGLRCACTPPAHRWRGRRRRDPRRHHRAIREPVAASVKPPRAHSPSSDSVALMGRVSDVAITRASTVAQTRARPGARRAAGLFLVWTLVLGNAAATFWLWANGGNLSGTTTGEALTSVARITGLLSAYMALIQVVLLTRLPALERLVGFDRLTVWHRWNGHATIDLVVAHVFFSVWGYALMDKFSIGKEISTMIGGGIYPGMITATIGTAFLIGVVATSLVIVRRRLRYEWWYAVHFLAYAGIALAWFHQIPTGNELVLDTVAADYWRALYAATLALLVAFRVVAPLVQALRYRLRVAAVVEERPGVASLWVTGRRLERLRARPGQFFVWRFLTRGWWWTAHPFS